VLEKATKFWLDSIFNKAEFMTNEAKSLKL